MIFKTKLGWMGLAATDRGVRAVVLPRPTRRAVERALTSLMKETRSVLRQVQHERLRGDTPYPNPVILSLSKGDNSSNGASGAAARHLQEARTSIQAYLKGRARSFDLPLAFDGQPSFRVKVWKVLQAIPYGRVRSYGWVARRVGKPAAARAVGGACGANPMPLLIPCHRVVAGDGSLGGFSGGLGLKKRLLKLEGIYFRAPRRKDGVVTEAAGA